jgi:hypothetical protein
VQAPGLFFVLKANINGLVRKSLEVAQKRFKVATLVAIPRICLESRNKLTFSL